MRATQTVEKTDGPSSALWTALRCARCRYTHEHPGPPLLGDLDRDCPLCRGGLGAVTVFRAAGAS
jgi:hypothetical protein